MFLAAEETPFVLQGPRPQIPPAAWETALFVGGAALVLVALVVFAALRLLRAAPKPLAPPAQLEASLRLAEAQPAAAAIDQATRALRTYLAAVEPRAAVSLSTEELVATLSGAPVFLPARQPLFAALRSADAVKFAGASLEASLLIAGIREAAKRVEDARRTFARRATAPLVPPRRLPLPVAAAEPPPLPGPPPLPRKDHA
jgi:hypothetical protein